MSLSVCQECGKPVEQVTYWKHVGDTMFCSVPTPPPTIAAPQFINFHQIVPVDKEG
jgi:hypothetical protein